MSIRSNARAEAMFYKITKQLIAQQRSKSSDKDTIKHLDEVESLIDGLWSISIRDWKQEFGIDLLQILGGLNE